MKRIYGLLLVMLCVAGVKGQQDVQWNHFMFDKLSVNPAYAGMGGTICGGLFFRRQWDGYGNSNVPPTSGMLNLHSNIGDFVSSLPIGVGITYVNDKQEPQKYNQFRVNLAYHYQLPGQAGVLSGGVSWGILNTSIKNDWIYPDGAIAGSVDMHVPDNGTGVSSTALSDLGVGLYYKKDREMWAGFSVTHLLADQMDFSNKSITFNNARHMYLMGGYNLDLDGQRGYGNSVVRMSANIKTDMVETQPDINVNYLWNQTLWGGLTWRVGFITPMIGYQTQLGQGGSTPGTLKAGYSYGISTNAFAKNGAYGSHEFFVTYCINLKSDNTTRIRTTIRPVSRFGY